MSENLSFHDTDLTDIDFSQCKMLECFNCTIGNNDILHIVSSKLTYLKVPYCNIKEIYLDLPNLEVLDFSNNNVEVCNLICPKLKEISSYRNKLIVFTGFENAKYHRYLGSDIVTEAWVIRRIMDNNCQGNKEYHFM